MGDLRLERTRRLEPIWTPPVPANLGTPAMVGQVTTATPVAGSFVFVNPVMVTGVETEGGAGTTTVGTGPVPVLVLGTCVMGDLLICRMVDHRWVAERGGVLPPPPYGYFPLCSCNAPGTLQVRAATPAGPPLGGYCPWIAVPATLTYGPAPSDLGFPVGPMAWYSDRQTTSCYVFGVLSVFYIWRYMFFCGLYATVYPTLTTVMCTDSPLGYPGPSFVGDWTFGGPWPLNVCSPFGLNDPYGPQGITVGT